MNASVSPTSVAARWQDGFLTLAGPLFREQWQASPQGELRLVSFRLIDGPEWIADRPAPPLTPTGAPLSRSPEAATESSATEWTATFTLAESATADATGLVAELRFTSPAGLWRVHRFQLHPLVAGTVHQVFGPEIDATLADFANASVSARTGNLRIKDNGQMFATLPSVAQTPFGLSQRHLLARTVEFVDQSDHHSNLVFSRDYLLHPGERCLPLSTNLVCVENPGSPTGDGFLWLLMAPLRHVRKAWSPFFDFLFAFQDGELVATSCPTGYAVARVAYSGGSTGATLALHALQRAFYGNSADEPGRLLSNTWGDRAGAAHLSESFVLAEIAAARELGVEVVQIDDGWQKGDTVNTTATGGVWNGFWAADPEFWTPHPTRFPRGLAPLVEAAESAHVQLGLWYAPDSTNDLANWERDAAQILRLWREHRIAHFKLDALKLHSRLAETRFHALCDRVLAESGNAIFFDFDVTAERRPTYWGRPGGGPLFLENRYTDDANYHPHQTLRAIWTLAHYVRPERIRAEFLNPARNHARYGDDPLQPAAYPPEYLFAVTLPTSPLAWFELSRVPREIVSRWQPLIATWKKHRAPFHAGDVLPVGAIPNGFSWTGFVSHRAAGHDGAPVFYALIFRELTAEDRHFIELPANLPLNVSGTGEILAGTGEASLHPNHRLEVRIPAPLHFVYVAWRS